MRTSLKLLICGSSKITQYHIRAIQKLNKIEIGGIFSNNFVERDLLSKLYNIKKIHKLEKQYLKNFDLALITSSTNRHFNYFKILSKFIKKFIIEKPIVMNMEEFTKLKNFSIKNNIFFRETNLFYKNKVPNFFEKINIKVNKKRIENDFKDHNNRIDYNKSISLNHLPHYYDLIKIFLGKDFDIKKIQCTKFNKKIGIYKKIKITFRNNINQKAEILVDLDCKTNSKNRIMFSDKNYFINLLAIIFNFLIKKFNIYSISNIYKEKLLIKMYKKFYSEINNDQFEYIHSIEKKMKDIMISKGNEDF